MPPVRADVTAETSAAALRRTPAVARKRVTVLGATGSVGTSTLDLIGRNPHLFEVVALTAQSNVEALAELAVRHRASLAVVADDSLLRRPQGAALGERHRGRGRRRRAHRRGRAARRLRDGGHHRRCRPAPDAGGRQPRPARGARQQGMPGPGRRDLHEGRAPGRHRAGAGGLGALGRLPVDCRCRSRCHRAHRAHGLRRAVPDLEPGGACARNSTAGALPSQLVHGAENHHRFGHPDEQGARADRGLSSVSRRAGPARGGGASPVDRPCACRLSGRLDAGAAGESGHAHADRAEPGMAQPHGLRRPSGWIWSRSGS